MVAAVLCKTYVKKSLISENKNSQFWHPNKMHVIKKIIKHQFYLHLKVVSLN